MRAARAALVLAAALTPARAALADGGVLAPPPDDARTAAILREMPFSGKARALHDAYAAVAAQPRGDGAQHLWVFIGDAERAGQAWDRAAAAYASARSLGEATFWGKHAKLGAAEVLFQTGRFEPAGALFAPLAVDPDPTIASTASQRLAQCRRGHAEFLLALVAGVVLTLFVLLCAAWLLRARARFWPLPLEVGMQAPVLALLTGASFVADRTLTRGLGLLCAGELGITWVSASLAPRLEGRRGRILLFALAVAVAALAAIYLFTYFQGLIAIIGETLANGPEG